jgi:hypothetical protein
MDRDSAILATSQPGNQIDAQMRETVTAAQHSHEFGLKQLGKSRRLRSEWDHNAPARYPEKDLRLLAS